MNLGDTTLLLTRPEASSRQFGDVVQRRFGCSGSVIVSPLMEIVAQTPSSPIAPEAELIFTSVAGVSSLAARFAAEGRAAWCVGSRTARVAADAGYRVVGEAADAASLTALLLKRRPVAMLVHVAGVHRQEIVHDLATAGLCAETCVVYDQRARPLSAAATDRILAPGDVVAPSFSPRTTRLLAAAAADRRAQIHLVAISRAACGGWDRRPGEQVVVARAPDAEGILSAMGSLFDADPSLETGSVPS